MFKVKKFLIVLSAVLFCILSTWVVYNDSCLYHKTVAQVISVNEVHGMQQLTLEIKNKSSKGKTVMLKNKYDASLVYDEKFSR